jgi:Uma2 family endonuclease
MTARRSLSPDLKGECDAMLASMFAPELLAPGGIRRFSRAEYDRLVELGLFDEEHVELLRGMLVTMSPQGVEHAGLAAWFTERLIRALDASWDVRCGLPYAASDDSEPEPDLSVSRKGQTVFAHPSSAMLLVEVSNSSLAKDRGIKTPIYAEAGVPEYWIVDVTGDELRIEVHTDPQNGDYRRIEILRDGDVLRPTHVPIEIPVIEIPWKRDQGTRAK